MKAIGLKHKALKVEHFVFFFLSRMKRDPRKSKLAFLFLSLPVPRVAPQR